MKLTIKAVSTVMLMAVLTACGGGGGGDENGADSLLTAQSLAPSPYTPPAATFPQTFHEATFALEEVLAGYSEAVNAAWVMQLPLPIGNRTASLPTGVVKSCVEMLDGESGSISFDDSGEPKAGSRIDVTFNQCTVDNVNLNGKMALEITRYANDNDFDFLMSPSALTATVNGQTVPGFPGLLACQINETYVCYFSHHGRGWAWINIVNGTADGVYAVNHNTGTAHVLFKGFNIATRVGTIEILGGSNAMTVITPMSQPGRYTVTINVGGTSSTYELTRP